jgi:hypothetical protein
VHDALLERALGALVLSSTVIVCLIGATLATGLSVRRACGAQRSMMRDLSR